ncbi:hypothetical protein BD560DRAFT_2336 [Blakeslea trispora]|nr:hypothetical protein BD560DRAFT_2336 [Blakeslea trispora]
MKLTTTTSTMTADSTTTTSTTTTVTTPTPTKISTTTTTFTPTSTYRYQTLSWLTDMFSIQIPTNTGNSDSNPSKTTSATDPSITASGAIPSKSKEAGTDPAATSTTTTSTTAAATPTRDAQSLPEYIAPNVNAIIPSTSSLARMKFKYIPYSDLVRDAVLTAQFVQSLPVMLSKSLGVTADDIIVVSITSARDNTNILTTAGAHNKRKRDLFFKRDNSEQGVVVSIAIPSDRVDNLQTLIDEPTSTLYSSSNGQLASLIDSSYPVRSSAANTDSNSSNNQIQDPNNTNNSSGNTTDSTGGSTNKLSRGAIIGICVSIGVTVYAIATVATLYIYRKRRDAKRAEAVIDHQNFAQSISSPIMQDNAFGWLNNHSPQHLPREQDNHNYRNQW